MPAKSKIKGNKHELATARTLSEWWSEEFRRMPNSGALRWGGVAFTYGDLLPPESFPAIVECKHYKEIDLSLLLRGKSPILDWWGQVVDDVHRCLEETGQALEPLLVFRANGWKSLLAVRTGFLIDCLDGGLHASHLVVCHDDADFAIIMLDDFLQLVDRARFLLVAWNTNR